MNNNETRKNLEKGEFLSIELSPSLNKSLDFYLSNKKFNKILPMVSDIIVTDSPLGKYTHNPILSASYIQNNTCKNTIVTFAMRDKNTPYALAEIITAEELKVDSYMFVTGDKTADGKNVFEKNSTDFMKEVCIQKQSKKLNTLMFSTCSNNLTDITKKKIKKKILNGADVIISQPIKNVKEAIEINEYIKELNNELCLGRNVYFVAGFFPIVKLKTAIFLRDKVKGAEVSEELFKILELEDEDNLKPIEFNKKIFNELIDRELNVHLMTANNFDIMLDIISRND